MKSAGPKGLYQSVMPTTSKNIGKNRLKSSGPIGDIGEQAANRRLRQLAKRLLRKVSDPEAIIEAFVLGGDRPILANVHPTKLHGLITYLEAFHAE